MRVTIIGSTLNRMTLSTNLIPRVGETVCLEDGLDYVVTEVIWDFTMPENAYVTILATAKD